MPMRAPTVHNPALIMDWMRFSSDTQLAYARMQLELLHELTPEIPVTNNLRALYRNFDHFDMADALDFVSFLRLQRRHVLQHQLSKSFTQAVHAYPRIAGAQAQRRCDRGVVEAGVDVHHQRRHSREVGRTWLRVRHDSFAEETKRAHAKR